MMYLIALLIAVCLGTLCLRLVLKNRPLNQLSIFLGAALGFGLVSQIIFYLQLVGNNFNHFLPLLVSIILLGLLIWLNQKGVRHLFEECFSKKRCLTPFLLVLPVLAVPLWFEACHYPMGGWDAWSCWNLKAKFIYFGEHHWKDMFSPILWRSNTGYPLGLPTLNVWFWQWTGFSQNVCMLNAIVLTLVTAGVLLLGLQALGVSILYSTLITGAVFTLAFGNTLFISQYSDVLFGLYLLCFFVCYLLSVELRDFRFLILSAIFIGLLSFTKNEGLAAAGILCILLLIEKPSQLWKIIGTIFLAALPMIIFTLTMAPHGDAFINGLLSPEKPSTFPRFLFILSYTLFEFLSLKWMGLWALAALGIGLGWKKAFQKPLAIIGLFMAAYLMVTIAYYQTNMFFDDIKWWMDNTLHRIIFALMPSVFLWMGISFFKKDA